MVVLLPQFHSQERSNMSLPPASIIHITIHNLDLQANTVMSSGRGGRVTQGNVIQHHFPVTETYSNGPESSSHTSVATERRIEAQPLIRRKLEEVSTQPGDTLSRIGLVALLATRILSAVEVCQSVYTGSDNLVRPYMCW